MTGDGSELLSAVKSLAESARRIADHLTRPATKPVSGESLEFYNKKPQPEPSHGESHTQRPRQAART